MKIYTDIRQGTEQWYRLRAGRPTASNFDKIVTPKKCELSKSASTYALRLVAERLLKMPLEAINGELPWMERGKELEPAAVRQYEFTNEVETFPVGFITTDDGRLGCSPDRLVLGNQRHALEVKCPSPHVHLGYLLNGTDDDYKPQVQGQIYVGELDRVDLYSYHPMMPPATVKTTRDEEYIDKLASTLRAFTEMVDQLTERAASLGVYQARETKEGDVLEALIAGEAQDFIRSEA